MTTTLDPEVFDRAAERVERSGLAKSGYYPGWDENEGETMWQVREKIRNDNLRCCSLGAIAAEVSDADLSFNFDIYADFFARVVGVGTNFEVPGWNDRPSRRKNHVVKAFRKAAEHLRGPKHD